MKSYKLLYILMIFAMIAWGETWVSAKILNEYLSAKELIFWRFFWTAVGLVPILIYFRLSLKISFYNLIVVTVCAVLLAFYNLAFFLGTKYGLASFGGVLVTTLNPIVTFLLIAFISKRNLSLLETFALIVGAIGTMVILNVWTFDIELIFSKGNIYYLIASFVWPLLTITSAKQKNMNSLVFAFYMFGLTSFFVLGYLNFKVSNITVLDFRFWVNLLLLSLYGTTFATTVYFIGVKELGSKIASSFFFLVPTTSLIFSIVFLKEKLSASLIIGGILTILSVYMINFAKTRRIE